MANILGVDLGTTNTSATLIPLDGTPVPLALGPAGRRDMMRTAALKLSDTKWLAGDEARRHAETHPEDYPRLLTAFKPLLMVPDQGHTRWVAVQEGGSVRYVLEAQSLPSALCPAGFKPVDIRRAAREMLRAVRGKLLETYPHLKLDRLVIGIPVGYPDSAKDKLLESGVEAGLVERRGQVALFPEPLAVALTYGIEHRTPKRVLVFDHGGGTLDLTILDVEGRPNSLRYKVLAQRGHDRAGRYYDRLLLSRIFEQAGPRGHRALSLLRVRDAMQVTQPWLLDEAERVKERLCRAGARGTAPFNYPIDQEPFRYEVSTELFEDAISAEIKQVRTLLEELLEQADRSGGAKPGTGRAGVETVLLAGGSSLIPAVRRVIEELLPGVEIYGEYAGTRTATAGFASAVQYRNTIDELTEQEYSLFDPAEGGAVTSLPLGTRLSESTPSYQRCREEGFYFRAPAGKATLLLFEGAEERRILVMQGDLTDLKPESVYQAVVTVDRETGRPGLSVFDTASGREVPVESISPGDRRSVAVLQLGQVVRYAGSDYPGHPTDAKGCIDSLSLISPLPTERRAAGLLMAVGDLHRYRIKLHHPEGDVLMARVRPAAVERFEITAPRAGEVYELTHLPDERFQPVGLARFYPPERTTRPDGCAGGAPAAPGSDDGGTDGPSHAKPERAENGQTEGGGEGGSRSLGERLRQKLLEKGKKL